MKTILKASMLFALFVVANTVFAGGNLKLNIVPLDAEKALVAISSLTGDNLQVSVKDNFGRIVYYKETVAPVNDYRKVFNFSELEDGYYTLEVVSEKLTTEREFQMRAGKIKVGAEKTSLEPFFAYEDGLLKCSYLNFNKERTSLYFMKDSELLYSKEIGRNFTVSEALNLSKLDEGTYTAVLSSGEKEYTYPIEIK